MIRRLSENLVLRPEDLKPLRDDFEVVGVFNPAAVRIDDDIVLLVRVAERPKEHRPGYVGLPRRGADGETVVDWALEDEWERADARVVSHKASTIVRLTSISHLRVFHSRGGSVDAVPGATLQPESGREEFGIEDPRITEIEGKYWITYVAVSRHGVATALASSIDLVTFQRHGVIFCPENKDVVLFPDRLDRQYAALHRPNARTRFGPPQIWLARSADLLHWGQHESLFCGHGEWESDRVGAGPPPVLLKEGWLAIYHGSQRAERAGEVGAYSAGALLLDGNDPARILRRSRAPIMRPTAEFERSGFVNNVVFPTALLDLGETLRVYYGAADTYTGVVEFSCRELLAALH